MSEDVSSKTLKVRKYEKEDYHLIEKWMSKHGMDIPKASRLPEWGIIVNECAMLFLVRTDCRTGIMEYFITDPDADMKLRQEACDIGIRLAEEEGTRRGDEIIAGTVSVPRCAELLHSYGYISDAKPYVTFRKLLVKGNTNVRSSSHYTEPDGSGIESESRG